MKKIIIALLLIVGLISTMVPIYGGALTAGQEATDASVKISKGVKNTKVKAMSITGYGKKIIISWTKSKGYKLNGYEVYRSTKKKTGYEKMVTTKKTTYDNTKNLIIGTKYYYKVRGFRVIEGKKVYTPWSNLAYRKAIKKEYSNNWEDIDWDTPVVDKDGNWNWDDPDWDVIIGY